MSRPDIEQLREARVKARNVAEAEAEENRRNKKEGRKYKVEHVEESVLCSNHHCEKIIRADSPAWAVDTVEDQVEFTTDGIKVLGPGKHVTYWKHFPDCENHTMAPEQKDLL